jgi:hypothetical protein
MTKKKRVHQCYYLDEIISEHVRTKEKYNAYKQTSLQGMDGHNTGEDAKVTPKLKHNCAVPFLVQQIDQILPINSTIISFFSLI